MSDSETKCGEIAGALANTQTSAWPVKYRQRLEETIGKAHFDEWFAKTKFIDGRPPLVVAETRFKADWICDRYGMQLCRIFEDGLRVTHSTKAGFPSKDGARTLERYD
jgi:chromosomal replication initiation ATPase DnaA